MTGTPNTAIAIASGTFATDTSEAPEATTTISHVNAADQAALAGLTDCDALVVGLAPLGPAELAALPSRVRVIGRAGIGLDSIDLAEAERLGIAVVHQPSYATDEVADHATALVYALTRHVVLADTVARTAWPSWDRFGGVPSLAESTLGLVGIGRIGAAVARRLAPAVGRILAFDPGVTEAPDGIELVGSLDELLRSSTIVSLHAPLTPQTTHLINAAALAAMPAGSFLVNVSRGGLVDEHALAAALADGHLAGAAVDVLSAEPPPAENPLLSAARTILSPHMAWLSRSSQDRLRRWTLTDVALVAQGAAPRHGRLAVNGSPKRR
ncbi:NAD(P)-dependent oxidoreductase [Dactylosporangium sp. NPDC051485]|uniref:NAD(P)-dependent oxidoreductase n=1 Tax=Dactylosporangium sp. NPDC051485 TaxID=3154846 RepID=UPI0034352DCD